jgi:hypothetical protein
MIRFAFRRLVTVLALCLLLLLPARMVSAVVVSDLLLGQAILDPGADPSTHATSFSAAGGEINARNIAILGDFLMYDAFFGLPNHNRFGDGLNISTDGLVSVFSPFFASCSGMGFDFDSVCGTAQWALSFYEQRGPLEAEYGKPSRDSRPVASIAWGTIENIQLFGDTVMFDMIAASVLTDGSLDVPDAEWIDTSVNNVLGTNFWRVRYDTSTLTGIAQYPPCRFRPRFRSSLRRSRCWGWFGGDAAEVWDAPDIRRGPSAAARRRTYS